MSFSVRNDANGLEYNGHSLSSLFAQKRNVINVRFYRFLAEIMRFNRLARDAHATGEAERQGALNTLGDFLNQHGFSDYFCQNYILPMGAAIWSSTLSDMRGFPLAFFLRFFQNHGLLDIANRPQWYVIPGGSREYVKKLTPAFEDKIHLNSPVTQVRRTPDAVWVTTEAGEQRLNR
jgi:Predicted NAD/FAD-binding protein